MTIKTMPFLLIIAAFAFRCGDEQDKTILVDFDFVLPLTIQPNHENFHVGDTLWLFADFPDTLLEFNSNTYYKLRDFDFLTKIGFIHLLSNDKYGSELPGAAAAFQLVNKIGSTSNFHSTYGNLKFDYVDDRYKCQIGIIPTKAGIYCVTFLSPMDLDLSMIDLGVADDGRKKIPDYKFLFYDINNGDTNVTLLRQHMKLATDNVPSPSNIYGELRGTFAFEVK